MYKSVIFHIFTEWCNYYHCLIPEQFHHPQKKSHTHQQSLLVFSHAYPRQPLTNLPAIFTDLPVVDISHKSFFMYQRPKARNSYEGRSSQPPRCIWKVVRIAVLLFGRSVIFQIQVWDAFKTNLYMWREDEVFCLIFLWLSNSSSTIC